MFPSDQEAKDKTPLVTLSIRVDESIPRVVEELSELIEISRPELLRRALSIGMTAIAGNCYALTYPEQVSVFLQKGDKEQDDFLLRLQDADFQRKLKAKLVK